MAGSPRSMMPADLLGLGQYRQLYARYGSALWGWHPSSAVQHLFDELIDPRGLTVLDLAAGNGKNALEAARRGARRVVAVDIDSLAALALLRRLAALESAAAVTEGTVAVVKDDAMSFLEATHETFDIVICYGLLHVFRDSRQLSRALTLLQRPVRAGGYLVIQSLTNRHPPPPPPPCDPLNEPYLSDIAVSHDLIEHLTVSQQWRQCYFDDSDITRIHQHTRVHDARYGCVRAILERR
jgi:SAM-dependent methyltransferase